MHVVSGGNTKEKEFERDFVHATHFMLSVYDIYFIHEKIKYVLVDQTTRFYKQKQY